MAGVTKPGEVSEILALYLLKSLSLDCKANPAHCQVDNTTLCNKLCFSSVTWGRLVVLRFPPPIKLTTMNDITEILLKVSLNTITP
jgi:hypothetical protein